MLGETTIFYVLIWNHRPIDSRLPTKVVGLEVPGIRYTLPEPNISPENRPLEEEIPIGNHHFQGLC